MPKTSHGPEPKAAPPSLVVLLKEIEDRPFAADLWLKVNGAKERAEVLEERLVELHDAVEKAIRTLNEAKDLLANRAVGNREQVDENVQAALGTLYRVL